MRRAARSGKALLPLPEETAAPVSLLKSSSPDRCRICRQRSFIYSGSTRTVTSTVTISVHLKANDGAGRYKPSGRDAVAPNVVFSLGVPSDGTPTRCTLVAGAYLQGRLSISCLPERSAEQSPRISHRHNQGVRRPYFPARRTCSGIFFGRHPFMVEQGDPLYANAVLAHQSAFIARFQPAVSQRHPHFFCFIFSTVTPLVDFL